MSELLDIYCSSSARMRVGVGITLACLLGWLYFLFAFTWYFALYALTTLCLVACALVDNKYRVIPHTLLAIPACIGVFFAHLRFMNGSLLSYSASFICFILCIIWFVFAYTNHDANAAPPIGAGDIKLLLVLSLYMTPLSFMVMLVIACIGGLCHAALIRQKTFPWAPSIVFAWYMVMFTPFLNYVYIAYVHII